MADRDLEQREALLAAVARVRPEIERAAGESESLMTLPASSVDLLAESGGAVYKPNILERAVRDLYTATQHFMVSSSAYEAHGQDLLGMTSLNPLR